MNNRPTLELSALTGLWRALDPAYVNAGNANNVE